MSSQTDSSGGETTDSGTMFQVLNPDDLKSNLEVTQKQLSLMRRKNTAILQSHKSRLENINLLEFPDLVALEALRQDVLVALEKHVKAWIHKVQAERFDWSTRYGRHSDRGPDGRSIFQAEVEYILHMEI